MSDAQRRAVRSLLQVGLVQALIQLYNAFAPNKLTPEQASAITAVMTPLVVFAQNWLEDNTQMWAMLKSPASPGANPKPESDRPMETPPGL